MQAAAGSLSLTIRVRRMILRALKRIPPAGLASVAFHAALLGALWAVPWLFAPRPPEVQTARLVAEPEALPPPVEPPPPPPPDLPEEPPPPAEPDLREAPPDEPLEPDPLPIPPTDVEIVTPVPADPPDDFRPPPREVISVRPAPAPPVAAPPPPPPAPPPTSARPVPQRNRKPDYPAQAVERQWEGRVILRVEVLPDGSVGEIEVATSSGHAILDRAAVAAVRDWHFTPATAQGQPVRSLVEVPISFRLTE